ncbi:SDR family oxidoreductase [Conexibacter sp. JD483]|uniref:SDR family oxidoreductase n=1 Tax=unclassified Conexibacter TaxID=2627773 RepID=UPI002719702C|nr:MULTISPECIES: SDR family oxidoreductase [unclassified Conexibacter]MDO8184932.1 SDR family oxidoreductase [Conexibacter sp. CPCC 205706]MDO8198076.1 SDR family oxidoreductase [Conexibacter sp. CPCC 205762]MDR9371365.1 SDR family oxidoreductase [Conexibacter sp. JD483]
MAPLDVAIAGGHGQIALRLGKLLSARGDRVRGLIRNPDHADDLRAAGVEPVVLDLEAAGAQAVADAVEGADAVVFAAGAGPGSGEGRKQTMDRDGAVKLIEGAKANGIERYLIVSSRGADAQAQGDGFSAYLRAKGEADEAVRASGLSWTIVRPGALVNDSGTGRVRTDTGEGEISRDDVAATLVAVLDEPATAGRTFLLVGGDTPVAEAVQQIAAGS